jgi:hypothetical protein
MTTYALIIHTRYTHTLTHTNANTNTHTTDRHKDRHTHRHRQTEGVLVSRAYCGYAL